MEKHKNIFKPSMYVAIIVDDVPPVLLKALRPKGLSIWLTTCGPSSVFILFLIYVIVKFLILIRIIWDACLNYLSQGLIPIDFVTLD